jgi:HEAT repeat protein
VPALTAATRDDQTLTAAARALTDLGRGDAAVPGLLDALGRVDKQRLNDRVALLEALKSIGPKAAPVAPALLEISDDFQEFVEVQEAARGALIALGPAAGPTLRAALTSDRAVRRLTAAEVLFRSERDKDALGTITAALGNPASSRRAAEALTRSGADAVPALVAVLKSGNSDARRIATETLVEIGPVAKAASTDLRQLLTDPDEVIRCTAALALWRVAADAGGVPTLVELVDKGGASAGYAATVLGRIGPAAKAAVPALSRVYRSGNGPYAEAGAALKAIDPAAAERAGVK